MIFNNEELDYAVSIMQEALKGKPIQSRDRSSNSAEWQVVQNSPGLFAFNWRSYEYRVAPTEIFVHAVLDTENKKLVAVYLTYEEAYESCQQWRKSTDKEYVVFGLMRKIP
jgi:hypothetical protein